MIVLLPIWYLVIGLVLEKFRVQIPYFITEYMVTYSGGFVRRGIFGQIALTISDLAHIAPLQVIFVARLMVATAFLSVLSYQCFQNRSALKSLGVFTILASPLLIVNVWYSLGSLDLLFILFTAAHLGLTKLDDDRYWKSAIALFSTAGVFLVLGHEGFLFLCLPVNVVILLRRFRGKRFAMVLAPILFAAILTVLFHGNKMQVAAIDQAWAQRGIRLEWPDAPYFLGRTVRQELLYQYSITTPVRLAEWALGVVLCLAPLVLLASRYLDGSPQSEKLKRRLWDYIAIPALCTIPLYFVGNDWHRWLALPVANGVLCILIDRSIQNEPKPDSKTDLCLAGWAGMGLVVMPMSLYFPPMNLVSGPLPITVHALSSIASGQHNLKLESGIAPFAASPQQGDSHPKL